MSQTEMDVEGSFIFHESNYQQSSFSAFQDMRIKKEHIDVEIKVGKISFAAHRVVLAARIPHFHKIFQTQDNGVLLFNETDPDVMESIMNFVYEGKLKITPTNVQRMFFAAACLHLTQVQQICISFLTKRLNSNTNPAISSFIKAIPSDDRMRDNFDEFCKSEEFLFLPYYSLKELISKGDLKVRNEEIVFEALIKWTKVSLVERQHFLPYLLSEIRMNYLSPEYLIEKVAAEGLIKMCDQCKHIVEEAKNYHLLKKRLMFLSFRTDPRSYLDNSNRSAVCDTNSNVTTSISHSDTITTLTVNQNVAQDDITSTSNQNVAHNKTVLTTNHLEQTDATVDIATSHGVPAQEDTVMTADQSSSQCNANGSVKNVSVLCGESTSRNVSSGIKQGIYAIRSFSSVGTFVSYYDHGNQKWNNFSKCSKNDCMLHVVSVKDKFYVFFPNSFEAFNLVTQEWVVLEPLPIPTKGAGVSASGNIIFVFGGFDFPNKIRCFDTQQSKWLQDETMKYPCRNMGVASSPEKCIFVSGGFDTIYYCTFLKFHTITKQWTELASMFYRRMDHSSAVLNDKVYVCGGRGSSDKFLKSVEVYDKLSNEWSFVSSTEIPRHSLSLVSCGSKLYIFGGITEKENCCCSVETYDSQTDKWFLGVPVPTLYAGVTPNIPHYVLPSFSDEKKLPAIIRGVVGPEKSPHQS